MGMSAVVLDMDGLMIESHLNPDDVWSDAKQQLTPSSLRQLLAGLFHTLQIAASFVKPNSQF